MFPLHLMLTTVSFQLIHLYTLGCKVTKHLTNSGFNNRSISSFHTTDGGLFRVGSVDQLCPPGPRLLLFCRPQHVGCLLPHGHKTVAVTPGITSSHLSIQEGRMGVRIKWGFYSSTYSWPPQWLFFPTSASGTLSDAPVLTTQPDQAHLNIYIQDLTPSNTSAQRPLLSLKKKKSLPQSENHERVRQDIYSLLNSSIIHVAFTMSHLK